MEVDGKLVPILREGTHVIKMIFFKKLKSYLAEKYPDEEPAYIGKLSGAIINDLFGTPNTQEPFATFVKENGNRIAKETKNIPSAFEEMRIPLTDALRVQFLCDSQEDIDSSAILSRANELGILLVDREVPLPKHFMNMVRKLGAAFHLVIPHVDTCGEA